MLQRKWRIVNKPVGAESLFPRNKGNCFPSLLTVNYSIKQKPDGTLHKRFPQPIAKPKKASFSQIFSLYYHLVYVIDIFFFTKGR